MTLTDTNGPPLPATTGAPYRLRTRGKLVRETVAGAKVSNKMLGAQPEQLYGTALVYDATVEVTTPAGDGASDRSLEVRVDRPLSAYVGPTEKGEVQPWKADETRVVPLNGAGKVRLRFVADDLGCPTIRVRVAGAAGGVWTAIRPDAPVQQRLRTIEGDDLTNPAPGRRNPLPAGTSSDDANALADAFRRLTTQFPAAPLPRRPPRRTGRSSSPRPGASSVTSATRSGTPSARAPTPSGTPSTRAPAPSGTPSTRAPAPSRTPSTRAPAPSRTPSTQAPAPSRTPSTRAPAPSRTPSTKPPAPSRTPSTRPSAPSIRRRSATSSSPPAPA
ncbi:hypothetical protein OV079_51975 [Nannocystis pusilla]|uniref:Uncharacterized protein n=1 Tax=Nannocystis pusilla TaxID=889268 RepID=A0A9X3F274_9BACT|nr:hypothetical protein [Nannocystis pusilla]MCY1013910.1 hypothetical protein [Nannocystis pusilla]